MFLRLRLLLCLCLCLCLSRVLLHSLGEMAAMMCIIRFLYLQLYFCLFVFGQEGILLRRVGGMGWWAVMTRRAAQHLHPANVPACILYLFSLSLSNSTVFCVTV